MAVRRLSNISVLTIVSIISMLTVGLLWTINATAHTTYTVGATQSTYDRGATVTVEWSAPSNRSTSRGWIGIYEPGATDRQYKSWQWIQSSQSSGTRTFNNLSPGTYEVRIFSGGGYDRKAVSDDTFTIRSSGNGDDDDNGDEDTGEYSLNVSASTITAGESVTASYTAPGSSNRNRDWVGLYTPNVNDRSYESYRYTSSGTSGSLSFTINTPGTYEFRYFKNNGYTRVARSGEVVVMPAPVTCPVGDLSGITNYPAGSGSIVAFGDSLTEGVGATSGNDYVSQLERLSGESIINAGVRGDTTRSALERVDSDVLSEDPSIVIVWLGGNDVLLQYYDQVRSVANPTLAQQLDRVLARLGSGIPDADLVEREETFANLEEIVTQIQNDGAVVLMVGYSGSPFDSNLENRFQAVANDTGALYVPNVMSGILGRPGRMSDLIHPNDTGYGIIAERINQRLVCLTN